MWENLLQTVVLSSALGLSEPYAMLKLFYRIFCSRLLQEFSSVTQFCVRATPTPQYYHSHTQYPWIQLLSRVSATSFVLEREIKRELSDCWKIIVKYRWLTISLSLSIKLLLNVAFCAKIYRRNLCTVYEIANINKRKTQIINCYMKKTLQSLCLYYVFKMVIYKFWDVQVCCSSSCRQ